MSSRVNGVNAENLQDPPPIKNPGYANGSSSYFIPNPNLNTNPNPSYTFLNLL